MSEIWKPIVGCEGRYEVSDQGRVRSVPGGKRKGKVLTPVRSGRYYRVTPFPHPPMLIHRLVLETFVGPRPEGMECCHNNDDPSDNRLSNLRWGTKSENNFDRVKNGRHHYARRDHCKHGHPYTEENTMPTKKGARRCRQCVSIEQKKRRGTLEVLTK